MIYNRRVMATINANLTIPDNNPDGAKSSFTCRLPGQIVGVRVTPNVTHPFVGDLQLNLISPSGTVVALHSRSGGSADDIKRTYEGGALDALKGQEATGVWTLQAIDYATRDQGTLHGWKLDMDLRRQVTGIATYHQDVNEPIPDNDPNGIASKISVQRSSKKAGVLKASNLKVHLNIQHSHIGDLIVKLTSPSGQELLLHNRTGWSTDNIQRTLAGTQLGELANEDMAGDWVLRVSDLVKRDVGRLVSWGLEFTHDSDLDNLEGLDLAAAESLALSGVRTRAALAAAVPLEVSSILALRRHADPLGVTHHIASTHGLA